MCQVNSSQMGGYQKQGKIKAYLVSAAVGALFFLVNIAHAGPETVPPHRMGTVAIDPGHGGGQTGARGAMGLLEKTVTLELARLLALNLESDYRVVLTRSDDYHVDLHQRAAIANHANADLLISLHTGMAYRHTVRGRAVYFYAMPGNPAQKPPPEVGSAPKRLWQHVQAKHASDSKAVANLFKSELEKLSGTTPCRLQGAPLVVLYGADMPALLIEVGHISHPETEKSFTTGEGLTLLVKALRQGIDMFFRQQVQ